LEQSEALLFLAYLSPQNVGSGIEKAGGWDWGNKWKGVFLWHAKRRKQAMPAGRLSLRTLLSANWSWDFPKA
jgi:hypothetical protein